MEEEKNDLEVKEEEKVQVEENIQEEKTEEPKTEPVRISEVVGGETIGLRNSPLGLVSFIFSLIGLWIMGIPLGIVAVVTGIISIVKFNPEEEKNKWMGITGICVGAADIILVLMYLVTIY